MMKAPFVIIHFTRDNMTGTAIGLVEGEDRAKAICQVLEDSENHYMERPADELEENVLALYLQEILGEAP